MEIERLWQACLDSAPNMALEDLANPAPPLEQLLQDSRALEHVRGLLNGIWGQLPTDPAASVLEATLGIQVARAHNDDLLVARLLQRRSAGRFLVGDRLKASSDAEAALALLTHVALSPAQRAEERAATLALLANAQIALGRVSKALIALEEAISIAEARGLTAALGGYLSSVGNARLVQGRVREAESYYRRALELAERCRHPLGRAVNHGNLGLVRLALGDLGAAAEELGAGLGLAEELGNRNTCSLLLANLGLVHLELGNLLASRGACARALGFALQVGLQAGAARIELRLARIEREAGELDAADAHLARADEQLPPRDPYRAELAVERGWVMWARGAGQRAAASLQQGLALAERLGDVRLVLQARVALGYATARAGYLDKAQATLEQALEEARDLEDVLWGARARIGLAEVLAGQGDVAGAQAALDPLGGKPLPRPLRSRARLAQLAVDWSRGVRQQIAEQLEEIAASARERSWGELERETHARLASVRASERA